MNRHESDSLLHDDFDAQAGRTPNAIAITSGDATATYDELRVRSLRLAGALHSAGIVEGAFVGLHLDRSIGYYACVLALLRIGAAVMPLPPSYPRTRIAEILAHARLDAVIDHPDSKFDAFTDVRILHLAELAVQHVDFMGPSANDPHRPAFVLCSSGSTGRQKLIVRSHRSFYHRLRWTWEQHPYAPDERCVQKSTMTTTHSIYELFEPLLRGVPVWILGDDDSRDIKGFWSKINALSITRLLVVPSALQVALDFPDFAAPSIRVLVLMGEYVHHSLAGRALAAFPIHTRIYSIYGSTESSSTLVCDLREAYRPGEELPLGKPITEEIMALVLDTDLRPVAAGETGMLHIGGPACFSGYLRDPELTASVIVHSPVVHGTLHDTHDRVRLTADGNLHFVGRTDHTVKVRGFRVDLQEVERVLLQHPELRQAAVMLSDDAVGGGPLVGFYAPASIARATVHSHLSERLPNYMVPSVLVGLEAVARTASGKIDRRKLLADYHEHASRATSPTTGSTETEDKVGTLWGTLLKLGRVPADASFFEVGGTSLTAFAGTHRLREAFALDRNQLSDQAVYQHPTVRAMAALIDQLRAGEAPAVLAESQILVKLRGGIDPALPPLFLVASAGGTLGAYEKLVKALRTSRDVIGIRDPYIWGGREATLGFRSWIDLYMDAIRQRQPRGPYHVAAYSSAGAFGYEIARRLRQSGDEVALLALIDPFGMDRASKDSFGFRAMASRFQRPYHRWAIRLEGWWRAKNSASAGSEASNAEPIDIQITADEFIERVQRARCDRSAVRAFASLMELNSGAAFGLNEAELSGLPPEQCFLAFLDRVRQVAPELDLGTVERIFDQYQALQVPAQQAYTLRRYEGSVLLIEPTGNACGLIALQLKPFVPQLRLLRIALGPQDPRVEATVRNLSQQLREHFLCMRNDRFVAVVGAELDRALS